MERIRVLHVIARMNVGGPAVLIGNLLRNSDPDLLDQRLVTGWCAADEADFLATQATDIDALRVEGLGRAVRPWSDVAALRRLVEIIRLDNPDVVHTHTAKAGFLGRSAVKLARSRAAVVHTFHGHLLQGYFGPIKTAAVVRAERSLARMSSALVTVGRTVEDELLSAKIGKPDQYRVIYPGIELPPLPHRTVARRHLGIPDSAYVVGFMGRLTAIKRPDRMIEVAQQLSQRYPQVRFLVAGHGDQAPLVREAAQILPIDFLGWRSDVENVLAACDAMLLTSDNEGTPVSLIQAAQAGVPVVATNVGSVPEVVQDGVTGFVCETDAIALASALDSLIVSSELSEKFGAAAQERGLSVFGIQQWVSGHENLYRHLMS